MLLADQNFDEDRAGRAKAEWSRERPDLNASPMALFGRINEVSERVRRDHMRPLHKEYGLHYGGFDVLATLRRSGPPYALNPTALYDATMVTSGAMTARIDKLEKVGLVERRRDPSDRRGALVAITDKGFALIDGLMPLHVARLTQLLDHLSETERDQLTSLLGKLVTAF